jgi:hypothetical protein
VRTGARSALVPPITGAVRRLVYGAVMATPPAAQHYLGDRSLLPRALGQQLPQVRGSADGDLTALWALWAQARMSLARHSVAIDPTLRERAQAAVVELHDRGALGRPPRLGAVVRPMSAGERSVLLPELYAYLRALGRVRCASLDLGPWARDLAVQALVTALPLRPAQAHLAAFEARAPWSRPDMQALFVSVAATRAGRASSHRHVGAAPDLQLSAAR